MVGFKGKILPEHWAPADLSEEAKAELLSHSSTRLVWGEGNPNAPIFVILDNPGARENRDNEPFLCGTRETLQKGAHDANVEICKVYVTYLLKSRPVKKYDKHRTRLLSRKYLISQIKEHQPKLVFCLGDVVVQSYFSDPEASVKTLGGNFMKSIT